MYSKKTHAAVYSWRETDLTYSMSAKPLTFIFTWQRLMGAQLPYGNNEGMQPFALALSVELSQNNGMVRRLSNCKRRWSQKENKQSNTYIHRISFLKAGSEITLTRLCVRKPDLQHRLSSEFYS